MWLENPLRKGSPNIINCDVDNILILLSIITLNNFYWTIWKNQYGAHWIKEKEIFSIY